MYRNYMPRGHHVLISLQSLLGMAIEIVMPFYIVLLAATDMIGAFLNGISLNNYL